MSPWRYEGPKEEYKVGPTQNFLASKLWSEYVCGPSETWHMNISWFNFSNATT